MLASKAPVRTADAREPLARQPPGTTCTLTLTLHPGMLAGKAPVRTVDAHEPCLLALQKLLAVGVAGAAVVEGGTGGAIIANLSASDLRCAPGRASARSQPTAMEMGICCKAGRKNQYSSTNH